MEKIKLTLIFFGYLFLLSSCLFDDEKKDSGILVFNNIQIDYRPYPPPDILKTDSLDGIFDEIYVWVKTDIINISSLSKIKYLELLNTSIFLDPLKDKVLDSTLIISKGISFNYIKKSWPAPEFPNEEYWSWHYLFQVDSSYFHIYFDHKVSEMDSVYQNAADSFYTRISLYPQG